MDVQAAIRPAVLVVEDNPLSAKLFRDLLSFGGYRTAVATTGERALRLIGRAAPDLIVMDLLLPDIGGLAIIRQVRQCAATAQIPIVTVSACAREVDRKRALAAGSNAFLSKPISLGSFLETVAGQLPGCHRPAGPIH